MPISFERSNVQDILELTMAQKGILFHYLRENSQNIYNAQVRLRIRGILREEVLRQALLIVQSNNETLRSHFDWEKTSKPLQIILRQCPLDYHYHDLRSAGATAADASVDILCQQDRLERFDLRQLPVRIRLFQTSADTAILCVTHHHILYDGWSGAIFFQEIFDTYRQLRQGTDPGRDRKTPLKEINRAIIQAAGTGASSGYWEAYLSDTETTFVTSLFLKEETGTTDVQQLHFDFPLGALEQIAADRHVTIAALLYSALGILLAKYADRPHALLGTTVSGREAAVPGIEHVLGNFINTLPLRISVPAEYTLAAVISGVAGDLIDRAPHAHVPYFSIKQRAARNQASSADTGSGPDLFDAVVVIENYPVDEQLENGSKGLTVSLESVYENPDIPLVISILPRAQLEITLLFKTSVLDIGAARSIGRHFLRVLKAITDDPETCVGSLSLEDKAPSTEELLISGEDSMVTEGDSMTSVLAMFHQQAVINPARIAQQSAGLGSTYADLHARSAALAGYLTQVACVRRGDIVGILLQREEYLIPSLLAAWNAGAAFLPIDPGYPPARVNAILEDSRLSCLITRGGLLHPEVRRPYMLVDLDRYEEDPERHPPFLSQPKADDLAYVIYTSGSTGRPKGVSIRHASLANYIRWAAETYVHGEPLVFALYSSIAFDLTLTSIFLPLATGNKVILYEEDGAGTVFERVLADNRADIIKLTPSHLRILRESPVASTRLRLLIVGGEDLEWQLAKDIHDKWDGRVLIYNEYGPTEATIGCMIQLFDPGRRYASVPIGRPIARTRIYLLDKQLCPTPAGIRGELYIAGAGLAAGYLHNPGLTSRKFLTDPRYGRIYRTGDIAVSLADGNLLFKGRADDQIKIRGYRIEPGEIATAITEYTDPNNPGISVIADAVVQVAADSSGNKWLTAWFVANGDLEKTKLRAHLAARLPDYMVPAYLIRLPHWPLTANGKIDRTALPQPQPEKAGIHQPPSTPQERLLAEIWSTILRIPDVGVTDNFFALGGDSIHSIQVSARVRDAGYDLSVKEIVTGQTIRNLAASMRPLLPESDQSLITGEAQPTPIQYWFFEKAGLERHHFNQSVLLKFGSRPDPARVRRIFDHLLEHHDALRLVFPLRPQGIVQLNLPAVTVPLLEADLTASDHPDTDFPDICQSLQTSFNLHTGPLIRLALFHQSDADRLLIVVHHLVIDGVSWRILLEDFATLYRQSLAGETLRLPAKTEPFLHWSDRLTQYRQSPAYLASLAYWQQLDVTPADSLPTDHPYPGHLFADSRHQVRRLSTEQTKLLRTEAHHAFHTQINDLLLAALWLSLNKQFGLRHVRVDLESHGRHELGQAVNTNRTIGWFTSIYPVLLQGPTAHQGRPDLPGLIRHIKETLRLVPDSGIGYLLQRKETAAPSLISFNYLGDFDNSFDDGLFQPDTRDRGAEIDERLSQEYHWNIIGIITDRALELSLAYSCRQFDEPTVTAFMDTFLESLREVIDCCCHYDGSLLSPSDLTYKQLPLAVLDELQGSYDIQDIYPLSSTQEGLLFHSLKDGNSNLYFEQKTLHIHGRLDLAALQRTLDTLAERYESLRTVILYSGLERPIQLVLKHRPVPLLFHDLSTVHVTDASGGDPIREWQKLDESRSFYLETDALMRMIVLRTSPEEYTLIWSHHHIIMDGWCMHLLWKDFITLYAAGGQDKNLLMPPVSYGRYLTWLDGQDRQVAGDYWSAYLSQYTGLTSLSDIDLTGPNDTGDGRLDTGSLASSLYSIDSRRSGSLQELSASHGVTLSTVLQCAWGILLAWYNNACDVVFGSVVSGRSAQIPGIDSIVGLFINTVPARLRFGPDDTVRDLLYRFQQEALAGEPFHHYALQDIQSLGNSRRMLFDHIIAFENYPLPDAILGSSFAGSTGDLITVKELEVSGRTNYALAVTIIPGREIKVKMDYDTGKYSHERISGLMTYWQHILDKMCAEPAGSIVRMQPLTAGETYQLLSASDRSDVGYPTDKTIIDLFRRQVARTPDHVALISHEGTVSYGDLDRRSSRLAVSLRRQGVAPDQIIGLLATRSIETVAAMLAILKAGGAYLPIDPDYPAERINYLLTDSGTQLLLTGSTLPPGITAPVTVLDIYDEIDREEQGPEMTDSAGFEIPDSAGPANLCYVIYTSGTTGAPKGVMVEHRNVVRLFFNDQPLFDFGADDVWTLFHNPCFDFSVWEMYGALLFGGKLVIVPAMLAKDTAAYLQLLHQHRVTVLNQTPGAFYHLIQQELQRTGSPLNIRYVIFGGEALSPARLHPWKDKYPDTRLINMFGITETTVHVTFKEIGDREITGNISNIGKPIPTLSTCILDRWQRLLPSGVIGELYVGGAGVSRGYLGKEQLTAQRFVAHPYDPGKRLYRSGDLARILPSGDLEYLGRMDDQVKLRGFRIELGEIENRLTVHDRIKECVVLARGEGDERHLVAWYIAEEDIGPRELKQFLLGSLPDHMVPAFYVPVKKFPLTSNGKLDKKALPDPEIGDVDETGRPADDTQRALAVIWAGILRLDKSSIDIHANFFDLGGNSLKLVKMVDAVNRHFNTRLTVPRAFAYPVIAMLAEFLDSQTDSITADDVIDAGLTQMNQTILLLDQNEN